MTDKRILSTAKPLEAATALRDLMLNQQSHGVPPRLWPVVIDAENGGYRVVMLGFATEFGFEIL